ncbi:MAG: EAL domain-containing protein [Ardenticatenaceae bacterium]|nr:EAL domain-containing protein [Ardenticatenaceae bacterium]
MYFREPREPDGDERTLLEMAGYLAAIAIEQRQLTDRLAYQAQHDSLTGLPNRVLFEDRLQQAIAQAARRAELLALLFVDLDRFKLINDTLGHAVGDSLLQQVAWRLERRVRRTDTIARMGGDEFTLVATELKDPQGAARVAEKLLDALKTPFEVEGHELFVTGSIGISLFPDDGQDVTELLRKADSAMYRAKEQGKNEYQFYSTEVDTATLERLKLERQLYQAVERGELTLYYQPQFDLRIGQVVGLEALLRWHRLGFGMISPATFIPMAEESGLIISIGTWALREACQQSKVWQRDGHPAVKVAVNVSALQFTRPDFVEVTARALEQSGLEPHLLELELTESMLMYNTQDTALKLARLQTLGVRIAIDDFGTGYSSLAYLQHLPIDTLEIDRSFVRYIRASAENTPDKAVIVRAITTLAHSLQMRVVAEGVETRAQLQFLRQIGCHGVQGFLLSPALPPAEVQTLFLEAPGPSAIAVELGLHTEKAAPAPPAATDNASIEPRPSNV